MTLEDPFIKGHGSQETGFSIPKSMKLDRIVVLKRDSPFKRILVSRYLVSFRVERLLKPKVWVR